MLTRSRKLALIVLPLTFVAWIVAMLFALAAMACGEESANQMSRAGDAFGIINSLFTGLAMAGALLAYFSQDEQLHLAQLQSKRDLIRDRLRCRPVFKFVFLIFNSESGTTAYAIIKNTTSTLREVTISLSRDWLTEGNHCNVLNCNEDLRLMAVPVKTPIDRTTFADWNITYLTEIGEYYQVDIKSKVVYIGRQEASVHSEIISTKLLTEVDVTQPGIFGATPVSS